MSNEYNNARDEPPFSVVGRVFNGMLLGGTIVALLCLGYMVYSIGYSETGTVMTLTRENADLRRDLTAKEQALTKAKEELTNIQMDREDRRARRGRPPSSSPTPDSVTP